jgi:hypothetical protein
MATKRINADMRTARKYARAWVRLEQDNEPITERQRASLDRILTGLAHWYDDDLEELDCPCDACRWWAEQIHHARRARK